MALPSQAYFAIDVQKFMPTASEEDKKKVLKNFATIVNDNDEECGSESKFFGTKQLGIYRSLKRSGSPERRKRRSKAML